MAILVTGATGFLGSHLVAGLLERGHRLVLLVRAADAVAGLRRVRDALSTIGASLDERHDVTVCVGALDAPGLGLRSEDRDLITEECDAYLHCGASVRFDLSLAAAEHLPEAVRAKLRVELEAMVRREPWLAEKAARLTKEP